MVISINAHLLQGDPPKLVLHQGRKFLAELRSEHTVNHKVDRTVEDDKEPWAIL